MNFDFARVIREATPLLWDGFQTTVYISVVSIVLGMIVGLFSCFMVRSRFRILRFIAGAYVWVIRGTPMIVQAFFIFFGLNQMTQSMFGFALFSRDAAGILTVTLNAGAYFTEIFRAGIGAVDKGQTEAARSLGLPQSRTMAKVIMPQAIRISLPPIVNQWIISIKDTAILSAIAVGELMNRMQVYAMGTFVFFESFIYVAVWYLALLSILMILSKRLEARMSYDRKN
ncbi:MAG: amino acid ABC transporter permease [Oscillospiraceae bacterium]|nr:amino acid ABC transporter permease [Oscillospiraceae bacterium]